MTTRIKLVRELLRTNDDGLTVAQIVEVVGRDRVSINRLLHTMPDAYIDRWAREPGKRAVPVWCVVVPPPHCPPPDNVKHD